MRNFNLLPPVGSKLFFAGLGIWLATATIALLLHTLAGVHWSVALLFLFVTVSTGLRKLTSTTHLQPRWADDLQNLIYTGVLLNLLYVWVVHPIGIQPETGVQRIALYVLVICVLEYIVLRGINKYTPDTPTAQEILTGPLVAFVLIVILLPTILTSLIVLGHGLWMNDATAAVLGVWSIIVLYLSISTILWWTRPGDIYRIKEIEYAIAQHLGKHVLHTDIRLLNTSELRTWLQTSPQPITNALNITSALHTLVTWNGQHPEHEKHILPLLRDVLPLSGEHLNQLLYAANECRRCQPGDYSTTYWNYLRPKDLYDWIYNICYGPGDDTLPMGTVLEQADMRHTQSLIRQNKTGWMHDTFWYTLPVLCGEVVVISVLLLGYSKVDGFAAGAAAASIAISVAARQLAPTDRKECIGTTVMLAFVYTLVEIFFAFYPIRLEARLWTLPILIAAILLLLGARRLYLRN